MSAISGHYGRYSHHPGTLLASPISVGYTPPQVEFNLNEPIICYPAYQRMHHQMRKHCRKCGETRPEAEFHRNRKTEDGLQAYCKKCMNKSTKAYYATDLGKAAIKKGVKKQADAGYFRYGKGAISILRQGATKREIAFDLTPESLEAWWLSTPNVCSYCGISINDYLAIRDSLLSYTGNDNEVIKFLRFFRSGKHKAIRWMTIDRVENDVGYSVANIVKSC